MNHIAPPYQLQSQQNCTALVPTSPIVFSTASAIRETCGNHIENALQLGISANSLLQDRESIEPVPIIPKRAWSRYPTMGQPCSIPSTRRRVMELSSILNPISIPDVVQSRQAFEDLAQGLVGGTFQVPELQKPRADAIVDARPGGIPQHLNIVGQISTFEDNRSNILEWDACIPLLGLSKTVTGRFELPVEFDQVLGNPGRDTPNFHNATIPASLTAREIKNAPVSISTSIKPPSASLRCPLFSHQRVKPEIGDKDITRYLQETTSPAEPGSDCNTTQSQPVIEQQTNLFGGGVTQPGLDPHRSSLRCALGPDLQVLLSLVPELTKAQIDELANEDSDVVCGAIRLLQMRASLG